MQYSELYRNIERQAEKICPLIGWYPTVMKVTDCILNEQVTLQSQDPVLNECAARLGVSLRQTEDQLKFVS